MFVRVLLAASVALSAFAQYPGATWKESRPSHWSGAKLRAAREYSATIDTAAVMIVEGGAVVDEWGETARKFECHSVRKSLLSALYGIGVAEGRIDLNKTLAELGIDDNPPSLTDIEKQATIGDLLKARSGIYHPGLYETPDMKALRPPRGSHLPGTFWYYNAWDFNALGTIFEKTTGAKLFEEFRERIAIPLQMEDFQVSDGQYVTGPDSIHPAYPFRMTARDLARFGLLYLRNGKWRGKRILTSAWVRDSTKAWSEAPEYGAGQSYGYLWWVNKDGYSARGTGGHYIVVWPKLDLVVVHRVNTEEPGRGVTSEQFRRLLGLILEARGNPWGDLESAVPVR